MVECESSLSVDMLVCIYLCTSNFYFTLLNLKFLFFQEHYIQSVYDDYFVAPKVHVHEEIDEMDHFRPPHIEFRIGDVILTYKRIVGIIVGWSIDRAVR